MPRSQCRLSHQYNSRANALAVRILTPSLPILAGLRYDAAMGIKTFLLALLFALGLSADVPTWSPGTVVSVVNRPARLMTPPYYAPSRIEYTVRIESTDYVAVQVRHLGETKAEKKPFAAGEAVETSKDGKSYLLLRSATTAQKRLRIVRVARH